MNRLEHLMDCLKEESAEVIQAATKSTRFGLDDGYPGTGRTNRGDLLKELNELLAVVDMLVEEGHLPPDWADSEIQWVKKQRVIEYMGYARDRRGTLQDAT